MYDYSLRTNAHGAMLKKLQHQPLHKRTLMLFGILLAGIVLSTSLLLTGCKLNDSDGASKEPSATQSSTADNESESDSNADNITDNGKPLVLTTFTVIADMARNVAGEHLNIQSITKPGAEIHDYEPTPSDIAKAADAKLVLRNGLGLERWFERFMTDSKADQVNLSEGVETIDIANGEYAGKPNPHAWMSPKNGEIYVDNMVKAFSKLDPDHASEFEANAKAYKAKLQAVQKSLTDKLADLPSAERTLVTCEGAFSYLCRDADLNEVYLWPVNAENEGTPQQIVSVIEKVKEYGVKTVFAESTISPKAMQTVAESTGANFAFDEDHVLYVDSLSSEDGPVPSYVDLLQHDADVIAAGLTGDFK